MQLHNGEVPDSKVWAVLSSYESDPSNQFLDWFITPGAATLRYKEAVAYLKEAQTGGHVSRWLVTLPKQRMEAYDVQQFVYHNVITLDASAHAARLDVFNSPGKEGRNERQIPRR